MESRTRIHRVLDALLAKPVTIHLLVAAYVVAGAILVVTDYTLNDEGILTYYWASWARRDFVPVFFFQRIRPVAAALYAPASAAGIHWTLVAHVVVAALSLPMLAATARALGHRLPNLPALATALSPLYVYGGPAGLSNTDGVVGMVLALYLLCARRRPFLAGVVVGLLPWIRNELGVFCVALALHGLFVPRDRRVLAGIVAFPLLYAAAGTFYHHDPLWILHFPPKTAENPLTLWAGQVIGLQYLFEPLLAATPIVAVVVALRLARLRSIERTLLLYVVATALVMNVLPIFQLGNFGTSPRYSLALLPALALLISRAVERWLEGERPPLGQIAAMMLCATWLATRQQNTTAVAFLLGATLMLCAAVAMRWGAAAVVLAIVVMAAGPIMPIRREIGRTATASYLDPLVDWLRAHRDRITGPVLTNSQLLAPFAQDRLPGVDVRFIVSEEMSFEIDALSNPNNGQRNHIRNLCETDLYGRAMFAPIAPDSVPSHALMALRAEVRLNQLLPDAVWKSRLDIIEDTPQFRIARVVPVAARRSTD